ncbi:hypothetical protein [Absidia glauca]|uniref:Uncharacterized protein n=1 Tax=Absidia glauca TaxID=4829 RepID=A0A168QDD2_ABSGL|nr:hypothetical protein [Absidia glauca]
MGTLFGIKTHNVQYKYLSYSRWLVLLLYLCSWAFTVSTLILVATNNGNYLSCLLSELACDVFYSGTKILIYCWLIEKVWVVNAPRTSRWQTLSYRIHMLLLTPYVAIFSLMVIFHNAWLESDGICQIGLQPIATIPLIIINMYMTVCFVLPLMKIGSDTNVDWKQSRLHEVAKKTLVASVVCLVVSFANITALAIQNGVERGVVCLTCCLVDVVINVITVHWVTSQPSARVTRDTLISGSRAHHPHQQESTAVQTPPPHEEPSVPDDKTKRFRFDPANEQYGQFGNHTWTTQEESTEYHYMSATNTQIHKSPADCQLPPYPTTPGHIPPYHFANGRYVMVGNSNDVHSSPSSSLHESSSHSSKQSLTNIP